MLEVLLSWSAIFFMALIIGYCVVSLLYSTSDKKMLEIDIYLICGLLLLTCYAEVFSIFYKVGAEAWIFLLFLSGVLVLTFIGKKAYTYFPIRKSKESFFYYVILLGIVGITALWTLGKPQHYDTALYHAQAVRWIEEYGVVPGLGNLHCRLAYNSAFMPLQALFSFKWLSGQSLHTVNGFIGCFFLAYAILTNNVLKRNKLKLSDFNKFGIVIYIVSDLKNLSSLSSDTLAMLLVLYIFTKWCEFLERNVTDTLPYAFLCILCVWSMTLKLSTATGIILALFPMVYMISKKEWKAIWGHIIAGIFILLPWLSRNVIISGYLIYPYSQLDLFDVDWKMPASVLDYDKMEITVWARNVRNVDLYNQPFNQWIVEWFGGQSFIGKGIVSVGMLASIIVLGICISKLLKKEYSEAFFFGAIIVGIAGWLLSAPLIRYGFAYLLMPMCIVGHEIYKRGPAVVNIICVLMAIPVLVFYLSVICDTKKILTIQQEDYEIFQGHEVLVDNQAIMIPNEGDQMGYYAFPSTSQEKNLYTIEMRGNKLSEGFRTKNNT